MLEIITDVVQIGLNITTIVLILKLKCNKAK